MVCCTETGPEVVVTVETDEIEDEESDGPSVSSSLAHAQHSGGVSCRL